MTKHKQVWIHLGILVSFLIVSCIYFAPVLSGKVVRQGDMEKAAAMSAEQLRVKEATGTCPTWTGSMFSGMPGYQIATPPQKSIFTPLKSILIMRPLGVERNIGVLFLYLLGFYVALLAFGASPWIALIGALAFGLGSYNIIIIEAGHITKAWAMAMMAPTFAGMTLVLRAGQGQHPKRDWLIGGLLFTLAVGLQITFNHIQITFYTILGAVLLGLAYFFFALRQRALRPFLSGVAVLLVGAAFAFGCNTRHLLVNQEYAKYTMRGGSELTITPEDLYHDGEPKSIAATTSGLDRDYAFSWSYGIGETYTLLVPGAYGGGSGERVDHDSESYRAFHQDRMPLYWGDQPFTSGPVYFGAIVVFLFVLGLFVVRGPERWWLLAATLLAIIMSWGRNLMGVNEWLFNHLPLYNKFRTPSMSLVLANVTAVLMAALAIKEVLQSDNESADKRRRLNLGLYLSAGLCCLTILVGLLLSKNFSFSGLSDEQMAAQYGNQWERILDIFVADRRALFVSDSWRSLLLIILSAAALWLYVNRKLKHQAWVLCVVGVLVVFDLWGVDRRYLNEENFVEARRVQLTPAAYDRDLDAAAAANGDQDYRVLNLAVNTFNDSKPSAFHHQIGGYSAAKLRRYQDLIDFYLSRHINTGVLNMLNTRYFVVPDQQQGYAIQRNVAALGNAWFVDTLLVAADANEEILMLDKINPASVAVADPRTYDGVATQYERDSTDYIRLEHAPQANPDYLRYTAQCNKEQLAVFSEIFYAPDWRAYLDGKPVPHFRVNYVLRAMVVPAGNHVIEFKNEAPLMHRIDNITLVISIIFVVLVVGVVVLYVRHRDPSKKQKQETKINYNTSKQ